LSFSRSPRPARTPAQTSDHDRAGIEQIVEIDSLMRAVKIADSDMNNAGAKIGRRWYFGAATSAGKRASAAAESLTLMNRIHSSNQTQN
jgi:hypothetical protein